ncbi:MAG: DUF4159 domain-containing protein [Gemmatimonas sp.]
MSEPVPSAKHPRRALLTLAIACVAVALTAAVAVSQRGFNRGPYYEENKPYDGRYTFVRIRYTGGGRMAWSADYPAMERNFMTILNDLSTVHPHVRTSNIHTLEDPGLSRSAVAYLTEPGYWIPNQLEAQGLRDWLHKGGFLIVDDFFGPYQWDVFERGMMAVLPEARLFPMEVNHPVFQTFFHLSTLEGMVHPSSPQWKAQYLGIYENNDPTARLMVIINFNNDIGDYMEWSGEGWYSVNLSNDAYKMATNYVVYGLTH